MTIRTAQISDLAAIAACARAAYIIYVARIGREPAPMCADFADQIAAGLIDVLEVEGGICGFVVHYRRGDDWHLENVAVDPHCQGRGHGRRLINHAEARARALGLAAIELYTNARMTENLAIYPRLGYLETGRGQQDGFDRVFFRKVLT